MSAKYSQAAALWAITKASFKAIFSQPVSIAFSLLFPFVFIFIFGMFTSGGFSKPVVGWMEKEATHSFYTELEANAALSIQYYRDSVSLKEDLQKGKIKAALLPQEGKDGIQLQVLSMQEEGELGSLRIILENSLLKYRLATAGQEGKADFVFSQMEGRKHTQIDFVLPGQIGFSILFATLFGVAFTFYGLREQLVLKRFFASPVKRIYILLGIGISRVSFQLLNVLIIILVGNLFLGFTLVHGFATVAEMTILSAYMLLLLLGVGLVISNMARNDTVIPLFINVVAFPQMLLSGTFFSTAVFPVWLQKICFWLPLTQFNNAMRKLSFDGLHLWNCGVEIGILTLWLVIIYICTVKTMKWE